MAESERSDLHRDPFPKQHVHAQSAAQCCGRPDIQSKLVAYVQNSTSFEEEQEVSEHLCSCEACRDEVASLMEFIEYLKVRRDAEEVIVEELTNVELIEEAQNAVLSPLQRRKAPAPKKVHSGHRWTASSFTIAEREAARHRPEISRRQEEDAAQDADEKSLCEDS